MEFGPSNSRTDTESAGTPPTGTGRWSKAPTVLMVDDEPMIVEVGRHFLLRLGWKVLTAHSGESALANLDDARRPTAAVIDLNMPGIDGLETFERLQERLGSLGVVFTSGEDMASLARHFGKNPRVAFLQKPFTLGDFKQALANVLDWPTADTAKAD